MAELDPVVGGTPIQTDTFGNPVLKRIVQRFASASARQTANPTPEAGEVTYVADRGTIEFYHGGAWRSSDPPGVVHDYAGSSAPPGFLLCQGQAVSRTTFDALFAVIGTAYGAGDGSTTFNIPDCRGMYSMGVAASGLGNTLGATFGNINHVHSGPSHTHTNPNTGSGGAHTHTNPNTSTAPVHNHLAGGLTLNAAGDHAHTNPNTGSGGSHGHSTGFENVTAGRDSGASATPAPNHTHTVNSGGSHSHSVGNTGGGGNHSHTFAVSATDVSGSHAHTQGATGSAGDHAHTIGATGASGTANTGQANPPTLTFNKIIKT